MAKTDKESVSNVNVADQKKGELGSKMGGTKSRKCKGGERVFFETKLKMALYCTQGSGILYQQLLMINGIAWFCMGVHYIA